MRTALAFTHCMLVSQSGGEKGAPARPQQRAPRPASQAASLRQAPPPPLSLPCCLHRPCLDAPCLVVGHAPALWLAALGQRCRLKGWARASPLALAAASTAHRFSHWWPYVSDKPEACACGEGRRRCRRSATTCPSWYCSNAGVGVTRSAVRAHGGAALRTGAHHVACPRSLRNGRARAPAHHHAWLAAWVRAAAWLPRTVPLQRPSHYALNPSSRGYAAGARMCAQIATSIRRRESRACCTRCAPACACVYMFCHRPNLSAH
eukprot:COSAG01_NODE_22683_length_845_cov_6.639410_1_plen_262_part_10